MIRKWLVFFTSLLFFILSCEEEKVIVNYEMPYKIQEIRVPETISSTSDKPVLITAIVTHPNGNEGIQKVEAVILDSMDQIKSTISLFDDGSIENVHSGDVIAFDQVYSYNLIGSQLGLADDIYKVVIQAISVDDEILQSESLPMKVFSNKAPSIVEYFFPDSILVGFPEVQASFTVNDSNGLDDILWVILEGYKSGNTSPAFQDTVFNPLNNSPVFYFQLDSSYAAGKKDDYQMKVFAEDRVGDLSEEEIFPLYVENTPPLLYKVTVPDTMILPTSGFIVDTVRAVANDWQSIYDIASVYLISRLRNQDGTLGDSTKVDLFDNGDLVNSGDHRADDGVFSRIIRLDATNTAGTYIFSFKSQDTFNQLSNTLVDSVIVKNQ
jgi:hypothetical protein